MDVPDGGYDGSRTKAAIAALHICATTIFGINIIFGATVMSGRNVMRSRVLRILCILTTHAKALCLGHEQHQCKEQD